MPGDADQVVVRDLRLPRAVIGIMAGAALGVVGALLQGVTRNPIADPGLLGINAGASLAVVVAIAVLGIASPVGYIWFAFGGAAARRGRRVRDRIDGRRRARRRSSSPSPARR